MIKEARPGSLEISHDASVLWRHIAPAGTSMDDVLDPGYFRNNIKECAQQRVAGRNAWNKIEVIAEDASFYMTLLVLAVGPDRVETFPIIKEKLARSQPGRKAMKPDGYKVEFVSPSGWRAIAPNGFMVAEKLTVEEEAIKAAAAHAKGGE